MPIRYSSVAGGSIPSGTTADRPASPAIGDTFLNGTLGVQEIYTSSGWVPSTGSNEFNIVLNGSETSVTLDKSYVSGAYTITSSLLDSSFDIYLFDESNNAVGYSNTPAINASSSFNKIIVYGGTIGDLLTFSYKTTFTASSSTTDTFAPPYITAVNVSDLPNADDTVTVSGGNFDQDIEVWFDGANGYSQQAKSIVYGSSTSIVVTRPDNLIEDNAPYTIRLVKPGTSLPTGSNRHKLIDSITAGAVPTWVTPSGLLPIFTVNSPYSTTIEATDPEGGQITYSLYSGSLPAGISLNSNTGVLSGTPSVDEARSFVIRATDTGGNFADRSFTLPPPFKTEYVIVAGGGGGGGGYVDGAGGIGGGGGGAGGYRSSVIGELSGGGDSAEDRAEISLNTSYSVSVGAGGASISSGYTAAYKGSNSAFGSITSNGGGGGWTRFTTATDGGNGGSGGGGAADNNLNNGGDGTSGQGFDGGIAGSRTGAGGGGAASAGSNFIAASNGGGPGGNGVSSSITGIATYRAGGGGGGGGNTSGTRLGGDGGLGGGGRGGNASGNVGISGGLPNTGGGGGGGAGGTSGGVSSESGGSGVVILKHPSNLAMTAGPGLVYHTVDLDSHVVVIFTAGSDNVQFDFVNEELVEVEYLVIAGGGAGGAGYGGGGGAGGYRSSVYGEYSGGGYLSEIPLAMNTNTNYNVSVGAGGAGGSGTYPGASKGSNGANSAFGTIIALGGGGGGTHNTQNPGSNGGSGGAGALNGPTASKGLGTVGQGFDSGYTTAYVANGEWSPGGGGAGEQGGDGSTSTGGSGGNGVASSITGVGAYRAGGGGGFGYSTPGSGGLGGGGTSGTKNSANGTAGITNTGGGGGALGANVSTTSPSGGSGVVILRYPSTKSLAIGPGLTSSTSVVGNNKVTTFTSGTDVITIS